MRINLHIRMRCPVCGREGTLQVRLIKGKSYLIIRHSSPRTDHSIGPLSSEQSRKIIESQGLRLEDLEKLIEYYSKMTVKIQEKDLKSIEQ